jgi:Domain of unknown function (DUF6916)
MASSADLAKLKVSDFSPHLNAAFELKTPNGVAVPLKLTAADSNGTELPKELKSHAGEALKVREDGGFSLNFVAPEGRVLPQGIYPIKHPTLGIIEMFLTPTGLVHGGVAYHAVFS